MNSLKIKNSIFKILIEIFIPDKKYRSKVKSRWAKLFLKKHVEFAVDNTNIPSNAPKGNQKIIWQYWHQGLEQTPEIINKCFESIKKYHPDYDIRILTFDTIKNYIEIPQKYYDLLEQKKIPIAIFSDVLRLYLLSEYGGIWIDSTIYLTERLSDNILNSDFFVIQKNPKTDPFEDKMPCFFIKANADNRWIHLIKNAIESYWNENDYLIHYFMFEHIVTLLSEANDELKSGWDKMFYQEFLDTVILQNCMFEKYDKERFEEIKSITNIHKLTYKNINDKSIDGTYLGYILEGKNE